MKQEKVCTFCHAPILRRETKSGTFFCNTSCKGAWQRLQRENLGWTKEWLERQYLTLERDCNEIAREIGRDGKRVWEWLIGYGIPTRPRGTATHLKPIEWGVGNIGKRHTDDTKKRLSEIAKASGRMPFKKENGPPMRGKRGAETPNWKGGITPERQSHYSSLEWSIAVKSVWKRDNAICQRCGKNHNGDRNRGTFAIHHIVSFMVKELRSDPDNLVLLCRDCHLWVHSKKNINKDFL